MIGGADGEQHALPRKEATVGGATTDFDFALVLPGALNTQDTKYKC